MSAEAWVLACASSLLVAAKLALLAADVLPALLRRRMPRPKPDWLPRFARMS